MTSARTSLPPAAAASTNDHYRFTFEPENERVIAIFQGITLAESGHAMQLRETRIAPVYYFPREDVRMDLFERSDFVSYCPFKGNAAHYSLKVGDISAENIMWSYEDPFEESAHIREYVAFYTDQVAIRHPDQASAHAAYQSLPANDNPLLNWVLQEAPAIASASELTASFARQLRATGIPLWTLGVIMPILHPQVSTITHNWRGDSGELVESLHGFEMLQSPGYLNSPLVPIFEGAGGIRRRLDIKEPQLDFGILHDLHAEGATDYVAMPMHFSDGKINVISFSASRPGGFSTAALGHIYEILAILGRIYEVHALQHKASSLLDTYLGPHAGERVLNGLIRRGDGENIRAVIWFCDLRASTSLAQSMPKDEFLACLNEFYDSVAGSVLDQGGQILRFIGDAALAIFPLDDETAESGLQAACDLAIAAAHDAATRIDTVNQRRKTESKPELGYGIALHVGDVTYGNIGTGSRLEFTVIGEAANLAARIESMCKVLDEPVLLSAEFAACKPDQFVSLGQHALKGINEPQEIYALRASE